jgi:hypothetical protein
MMNTQTHTVKYVKITSTRTHTNTHHSKRTRLTINTAATTCLNNAPNTSWRFIHTCALVWRLFHGGEFVSVFGGC